MANKKKFLELIEDRNNELKVAIANLKNGVGADGKQISKATMSTQRYHKVRDQKILHLVAQLMKHAPDDIQLDDTSLNAFNLLTDPQDVTTSRVIVEKGDDLVTLLTSKYAETKDAYNKVMKAAEKAGLKLVGGKFA